MADLYNRTRLTPLIRKIFSRWLGFGRLEPAVVLSGYRHAVRCFLARVLGSLRLKKLPQGGKE